MGRKKDKRKSGTASRPDQASRVGSDANVEAPIRREQRFTSIVPVRFEPAMLDEVRRRAELDQRSVSAWIRRAVEAELRRDDTSAEGQNRRSSG